MPLKMQIVHYKYWEYTHYNMLCYVLQFYFLPFIEFNDKFNLFSVKNIIFKNNISIKYIFYKKVKSEKLNQ